MHRKLNLQAGQWLRLFLILMLALLVLIGGSVAVLDPFFHYHAPLDGFYYTLGDQRAQNDGITKHFSYDAMITGTSMSENFMTSQFDELFQVQSVKMPYPGATYKEINDNLKVAYATGHTLRYVLRPLDYTQMMEPADAMRTDMGTYPTYLYDKNPWNDIKYLFNRSALSLYAMPMLTRRLQGVPSGHTSFDEYGASLDEQYGPEEALNGKEYFGRADQQLHLSEEEIQTLRGNIEANVTSLAKAHPETTFLYFFPPYSAVWWGVLLEDGTLEKQVEAEKIAAQMMLECGNIRVFSFNLETDITADLNNYKDQGHYSPEVNALIMDRIAAGQNELTTDNLDAYCDAEIALYESFDYDALLVTGNTQ